MNSEQEDKNKDLTVGKDDNDLEQTDTSAFDPYALYEKDGERIVVPLKHTIKLAKRDYTELKIRVPLGGDLRIAGKAENDTDNGLILLERCSEGLTKEAVNKMWASDIQKCSAVLNFLSQE